MATSESGQGSLTAMSGSTGGGIGVISGKTNEAAWQAKKPFGTVLMQLAKARPERHEGWRLANGGTGLLALGGSPRRGGLATCTSWYA